MRCVPYADRANFWKFQSAAISFTMVRDSCDYLINNPLPTTHPIHDPLLTAIHTLYARPFKQQEATLRLNVDIIPDSFKPLHFQLITFRDKMFAHSDTDAPKLTNSQSLNVLAAFTQKGNTHFGISVVELLLPQVQVLSLTLCDFVSNKAKAIWDAHMLKEVIPDGPSIVNLSKENGPFLIPHPFLTTSS